MDKVKAKQILTEILQNNGARIAHFPSQKEVSMQTLLKDAQVVAKKLINANCGGIFLAAPNSYHWLVTYFACIISDTVLYTADFQLSEAELNSRIEICKPCVVLKADNINDLLVMEFAPQANALPQMREFGFVQFTSGTTGGAKGVLMRAQQIAANLVSMQELCAFTPSDNFLLASAMSHPMGHIFMLLTLGFGGKLTILESPVFLPRAVADANATIMVTPPVMLNSFKNMPDMVERLKKFRYLLCVGAPLDETAYAFYREKGIKIMNGYGMTECVSGVAMGKPDSSGKLIPLACCQIKTAPDGEILVRGDCVCGGYINAGSICREGWYHTNDLGEFDAQGMLTVTGRKDNLAVLQNGYKIALEPLEEKINRVKGVSDCIVRVVRTGASDSIQCEAVVESGVYKDAQELRGAINTTLSFYEKLDTVHIVEKLSLKGNKKQRG